MAPPTLSPSQVEAYFDRIKLPAHLRATRVTDGPGALEYLKVLQKHHLIAVPFENLSLHYGLGQTTLHPDGLFNKIVHGKANARGGYCMENNAMFGTLLRSLGFNVYPAGARVRGPAGYFGFAHMLNFVTIEGEKYHVDVGFGANVPTQPLLLNKEEQVFDNIQPAAHRLVWRNIDENTDPNQRLWVLEHRHSEEAPWMEQYCFTELEFIEQDYVVMNHYTSTSRHVLFTQQVICVRMVSGREVGLDDKSDEIAGDYVLHENRFKKRIHGKVEQRIDIKSEAERVEILKKYFGIELTETEKAAIFGLMSAIVPAFEL